ncbi:hypothetical protein DDQ41_11425 [Streptomyces spongiicola]|uniref:Exonuclease domain-containing protein n=1 Tax=Streptomyces spongiicola TaxID=1690221 RepID=A0ABM6V6I1_9ACTN|nr:hypothetical protein DDQ41_11425 [Streptomyces spongiicola]
MLVAHNAVFDWSMIAREYARAEHLGRGPRWLHRGGAGPRLPGGLARRRCAPCGTGRLGQRRETPPVTPAPGRAGGV